MDRFLAYKCTLPAHVQFFIHQYPKVLLRAALKPFFPQPLFIPGAVLIQVYHLTFDLVQSNDLHMNPLLKLVHIPLDGIPPSGMGTAPPSLELPTNLLRVCLL